MRRLTTALTLLLVVCWSLSADAYVRLGFRPEKKGGEWRPGHRIVQLNTGSVGRIVAGGDSNTRAGYSLIIDTADTFDSDEWINNPFTGGQILVEYVGDVRVVAVGGGAGVDDVDIGDAGDGQCWQASADGDVCLIVEDGVYDLPHDGTGAAYDKRVSIYTLEGITAKLTNDEAGSPTLQTDMSGAAANTGWLEFVGVEIEQTQAAFLWDWFADDDQILFSRVQFDYDNAPLRAFLFADDGDDASEIHMLDCWNTQSGAGVIQRIFDVDVWTDYLVDGCNWAVDVELHSLKGRGIFRNSIVNAEGSVFETTLDGNTLITNNIFFCPGKPISNAGQIQIGSSATSRRTFAVNNTSCAPLAGAKPLWRAYGVGESVLSGIVATGCGACTGFKADLNANQRAYNNRAYNVSAVLVTAGAGTWVDDDNVELTSCPFVASAAVPPDYRLNDTAGGGAACKGIVRRLPIVSPDVDMTGYPRDLQPMADAGAWQYRHLVRLRVTDLGDRAADFTDRLIYGQDSGAIGFVRDWDDYRIIDTDGSGVETVRAGSDGGSIVVDVISGTFQAEVIRTLPDDYSDLPVGM